MGETYFEKESKNGRNEKGNKVRSPNYPVNFPTENGVKKKKEAENKK